MESYMLLAEQMLKTLEKKNRPSLQDDMNRCVRGEMAVMRFLQRLGRRAIVGDISRELGMTTPRLAAVLNSLEKKGLVERLPDPEDRRRVTVGLTESGKQFCTEREKEMITFIAGMLEALGEHDAMEFVRIIGRMTELKHPPLPPFPTEDGEKNASSIIKEESL